MRKLSFVILFLTLVGVQAEPAKIFESKAGDRTYYHVEFTLTASNSSTLVPEGYHNESSYRPETNSEFREDGMFEVFIRASEFPVAAPKCHGGWIILRMPATQKDDGEVKTKITAKKALWTKLEGIYTSKSGSQKVVIELNPYIHVLDPNGPKLELEECNVFFRSGHGAYVPHVGPLDETSHTP